MVFFLFAFCFLLFLLFFSVAEKTESMLTVNNKNQRRTENARGWTRSMQERKGKLKSNEVKQ